MNNEREALSSAIKALHETEAEIYVNAEAIKGKKYAAALCELTEILKTNEGVAMMVSIADMNPTLQFALKHLIVGLSAGYGKLVCKHYEISDEDRKELYAHAERTVRSLQSATQSSYDVAMKKGKGDARNEGEGT